MKATAILIVTSILMSLGLITTGAYVTINNILHPQGNLFEGVVIFSLGVLVLLLLMIATTLGKAIQVFTDVYTQQIEIQKTVNDFHASASKPKSIGDILKNLNSDSITITNLETGETTSQSLDDEKISKIFSGSDPIANFLKNIIDNRKKPEDENNLNNLSIEQLEKELAKAIKNDEFEKAQEIKELIKNLGDNEKKD